MSLAPEQLELLRRVDEGETEFSPIDSSETALRQFQRVAANLMELERDGYLSRVITHKDSGSGRIYVIAAAVIEGLTAKGFRAVEAATSVHPQNTKAPQSASGSDPIHHLFICHASSDKEFVRQLVADLYRANLNVWIDEHEIRIGDRIREKIEQGLRSSAYLGVVLSPSSVTSKWVQAEIDAALMREIDTRNVTVLPIYYRDCEIPPLLQGKLYADFRTDYNKGLKTLLDRFKARIPLGQFTGQVLQIGPDGKPAWGPPSFINVPSRRNAIDNGELAASSDTHAVPRGVPTQGTPGQIFTMVTDQSAAFTKPSFTTDPTRSLDNDGRTDK